MKTKNIFLALLVATFGLFSCADESKKPILTYEQTTKGGYAKLIEQSDKLINVLNETTINSSKYTYSVEFVDLQNGALLTEYKLDLTYENAAGDIKEAKSFMSWGQGDLTDGPNGLRALLSIEITAPQMLQALSLTPADLGPGDKFIFEGYVTLDDGNTYGFANSSAAVNGTAFGGHFNFTLPAACPSDLTGSYAYESSDYHCSGTTSGTVEIVGQGGGVYNFSDWSFGSYPVCYGFIANNVPLTFTDVCTDVAFTGFVDIYGDTWDFTGSSIVGNEWTIKWVNTYGEFGTGVVKYPGGADWPITLVN